MKNLVYFSALLACALLSGCGMMGQSPSTSNNGVAGTATQLTDVMRVGDKITIRLSGVPDPGFFDEVQIPASGDVTVDLLSGSFHAAGRTAAELSADISNAYKTQKIYTNPVVTVIPEERYINVGGEVRGPSNIVYRPDSTVMSTINSCGGFTEYAKKNAVRIIRGKQVIYVDCVKAITNPGDDPAVYPGDQIYVPRTMF